MAATNLNELSAFAVVARAQSFTRAAAQLGVSQPALSQTIRGLEARLGIRLLTRTTRSVSPTEAGERLLQTLEPKLQEIEAELTAIRELRDRPAGTLRLNADEHAARYVLWPVLRRFVQDYPEVTVEVVVDYGLTDIAAGRFDAGVRVGGMVAKDMIAVRIGPDIRMATVGSPAYFATRPRPATPHDLVHHNCLNIRFPTRGGLYAWEYEKDGQELNVRVEGSLIFNLDSFRLEAALNGLGLVHSVADAVQPHVEAGALVRVLEDWCPPFEGYHLYYPSRRQPSAAFSLLVEALRHRGD